MTITFFDELSADSWKDPGTGGVARWVPGTNDPVELTAVDAFHSRYAAKITQATPGITHNAGSSRWHSVHFKYSGALPDARRTFIAIDRDDGTDLFRIECDATGKIEVWCSGASLHEDAGAVIVADTWYQISVYVPNASTCRIILRTAGGRTIVDFTTVDTITGAPNKITLGAQSTAGTWTVYFDNYICGTADPVTDIGSAVYAVINVRPNAAGDIDQFTGDYQDIDEHPADDADYINAGAGTGFEFLAKVESISAQGVGIHSILGVYQITWLGSGTSGTAHDTMLLTEGTKYNVSHGASGGQWGYDLRLLNPFTGVAWTVQEVRDAQIGGKVTDATGGYTIYHASLDVLVRIASGRSPVWF